MEQTPLPPLVSDEIRAIGSRMGNAEAFALVQSIAAKVEVIEADRQRTREVVQALVNMIHHRYINHPADTMASAKYYASGGMTTVEALALAKSINIEPTNP